MPDLVGLAWCSKASKAEDTCISCAWKDYMCFALDSYRMPVFGQEQQGRVGGAGRGIGNLG
jgi:hypothetical protein